MSNDRLQNQIMRDKRQVFVARTNPKGLGRVFARQTEKVFDNQEDALNYARRYPYGDVIVESEMR